MAQRSSMKVSLSPAVHRLINAACALAQAANQPPDARHLLLVLIHRHPNILRRLLPDQDLTELEGALQQELARADSPLAVPVEQIVQMAVEGALGEGKQQVGVRQVGLALVHCCQMASATQSRSFNTLRMGLNLNEQVKAGAIPQVVGRDAEIEQLMEALCRPINPYAVLVGLEGVGRRAVVQGLAQRIVAGDAPEPLRHRPVIVFPQLFDSPEFYLSLVEEASATNAILYLEPFEIFLSAPAPPIEAIRLQFLSDLVTRRVPLIGAVSSMEMFRQQLSRAPDLLKRFQPIPVHPLTAQETEGVLRQLREYFRAQFGIDWSDDILRLIVRVADERIQHRPFPDKAILLLDYAVGIARKQGTTSIEPSTVWHALGQITGLPIEGGEASLIERLKGLKSFLQEASVGQEEAIETLVNVFSLKIRRLDLYPERPNGVLLFVGPPGVGKTETAYALAEYFFGSRDRLLRLDMSQYDEPFAVAKLLGTEPFNRGMRNGSPLLSFVAETPFCVVLLEDIEKAHPQVQELLLQMFDEGFLVDAQGQRVSFADAIIVMTSNLKPEAEVGFLRERTSPADWHHLFAQNISSEFVEAIDALCIFKPLERSHLRQIIERRFLPRLQEAYRRRGLELHIEDSALDWLAEQGFLKRYGARELERTVERELLMLIAPHVPLDGEARTIRVGVQNNQLSVTVGE
jgi:ATP-dependent Clp protease ATP-binding subunit ClpA